MAFDVLSWTASSLLQSRGQFRFSFYCAVASVPIFVLVVYLGARWGAGLGVAIAVCLYYVTLSPLLAFWVFHSSNVSWGEILHMLLRPVAVGVVTAIAALATTYFTSAAGGSPVVQCGLASCVGVSALAITARTIMASTWHEIMTRFRQLYAPLVPMST
jgi:hypothetical protein